MSIQPYPKYKDTGDEWLEKIPSHWDILPLKWLVEIDNCGSYGVDEEDGEIILPVATTAQIDFYGNFNVIEMPLRGFYLNNVDRYMCNEGDILVVKSSGSATNIISGKAGIINRETAKFIFSNFLLRLKPLKNITFPKYIYYFITSHITRERIKRMVSATTYPNLQVGEYISALIPTPNIEEQSAIAAFLDRETAKIDALVAEQEKLIDLLKEKRQAVISHAVTKGLDPDVPMKDSGVEWLGQVPEHWEILRIKYLVNSLEQGWSPQCESYPVSNPDGWGVLKVGCVNGGTFNPLENKSLPDNLEPNPDLGILADDLLISRANTRELVGGAAVATEAYPRLMLCDKLYRLRFKKAVCLPGYIALFLGAGNARGRIEIAATGASSSMLNIGQGIILELPVPLPSIPEQQSIVEYLNEACGETNSLIHESQYAIDLLKERRAALISAAVTGKIDVRTFHPELTEAA